ncbi:high choriolytic enzyme 1-like isoform X3 [Dicentrarchus labrax]|uniref:Metalloendopeptidase n=1 Tax=Dicentrarchus labrax TaxID=13489 RepID=A0A8C4NSN7_DICLA|nr:high choriolytic enzyme 1-like isoform X2 [Dicentrarchus labrax]XP_051235001.1 high choriolytic enzyme 1-like isoform X3 [Dicentrarchus labrax]
MTPAFLFLLFLSLTAIPPGATDEDGETDVSSDVSEVIARANEGISTRLEHGDIVPNRNRNADPCTARGCKWRKRGRYVRVPVIISSSYTREERNIIIRALLTFHQSTCIRFVWRRRWHRNYLYFFSGTGCWSYLGRQSRGQPVSLRKNGCLYRDTVQHEVLHALGFHHEQVRSDRDTYVSILTQNIQPGKESNFVKVGTNNLGTPYDFNSVMHYSKYAFSRNGQPTIIARSNPSLNFGYATDMSVNDIARVNKLYQCRI